jgi:signal transduction histidine kinase
LWYSVSIYPSSEGISMYWQDITERKRAEESLRALEIEQIENATRIELQRRLLEFREQERQQIARDLHDGPVQDIYALILYIESVMDLFKSPEAKAAARKLIGHLQHTGQNLRNMIKDMRPPSLVRFGLARALQDYFEEFKEKHPQVVLDTSMVDDGICLSEQARMHLFRVCQEALSNVVRHARATRVTVQLDCKDDSLSLQIRDNGCGFAVSNNLFEYSHRGHFGLVGMRERIDTIGGTFEILSNTGNGTHISITVPLQK